MKIKRSAFFLFVLSIFFLPAYVHGQGFGTISKKKITLRRKLPAAVHLPGTAVRIQVAARDPKSAEIASEFSDILQAELLKYDTNLRVEQSRPDTIISCTITNFAIPPTQEVTRNVLTEKKVGNKFVQVQEPKRFYEVKGSLDLTYQAKDAHSGKTLDSDIINLKYSQEFDADTGASSSESTVTKSWSALKTPWNKASGKSSNEEVQAPPTPAELQQTLVRQASARVSARLVNTNEVIEVYLARGKLDDASKLADAGLWSRMLESLEQMPPLPNPEDDAYRLYNIGVAYEALGYQADDASTAKKFFDQAAISYGKAIDGKPAEKYFLEPQNRIETALAHYRKLEQQPVEASVHPSSDGSEEKSNVAVKEKENVSQSRDVPAKPAKAPVTNAALKEDIGSSSAPGTKASQDNTPGLTNDQVIKLFKAGMDEENLISTVTEARATSFDVSVDGQLQLVNAGIKGKLLAAIRRKAASQKIHR
jgi:tetratricopeptide (TPR) repeat protein